MEFIQTITRSEDVLNPNNKYYMDMNKIINEANKIKIKSIDIQKLAILFKEEKPDI